MDGVAGGNETSTTEDDGPVEVLEDDVVELELHDSGDDGRKESREEEEHKAVVDLTLRELAGGSDDTPDDGCSAEDLRRGTDKPVWLVSVAHAVDIREHPRLHAELDGTSDNRRRHLRPEHGPRRDLHVVTELEVGCELQSLGHGDVAPGLEHHHGDGLAGEGVADDELCDDVEADLLVRDGLDHADGDDVEEGDDEGEDEGPDGHACWPDFDDNDTEDEHRHWRGVRDDKIIDGEETRTEDDAVPPLGDLRVLGHQTSVDIRLLVHRTTRLHPDLLAEVDERMRDRSCMLLSAYMRLKNTSENSPVMEANERP